MKTILITGATSGIGRVSAEKLAKLGNTVLVHGRSQDKIDSAVKEIKEASGNERVYGLIANLANLNEVKKLAQDVSKKFDSLDVLINNAGLGPKHKEIFEVNYIATVVLTLELMPLIKKAKGRIVNISSEAQSSVDLVNFMKAEGMNAYAQSKLAVNQFSFKLAEEVKEDGVNIYALDPGSFLGTKMVKETWGNDGRDINIGANAHIKLALQKDLEEETGRFYIEGRSGQAHADAYKINLQQDLWNKTMEVISGN